MSPERILWKRGGYSVGDMVRPKSAPQADPEPVESVTYEGQGCYVKTRSWNYGEGAFERADRADK